MWNKILGVLTILLIWSGVANAATYTVCATGCSFTTIQLALNAATAGDVITLKAGVTYTESVTLPNKGHLANYITITSDAAAGSLPAAGVRTGPSYAPFLPKMVSVGAGAYTVKTAAGADHYKFRHIEFPPTPGGFNSMVGFGASDSTQVFESQEPSNMIVDQCYFHGDPIFGQKRGIEANAKNVTITNNYFDNINAVGQDSQCIQASNGSGPLDVENNFMRCGTENIIVGGADPHIRTYMTATGTPSLTSVDVTTTEVGHNLSELKVGQVVGVMTNAGTIRQWPKIATITGTGTTGTLTWATPLTSVPDVPGDLRAGLVLNGLTFRHNYVSKNLLWYVDGVLAAPTSPSAVASTASGTLAAGQYFYQVQAFSTKGYVNNTVQSSRSTEVTATLAAPGKITISWGAVSGAMTYHVWRGTTTGAMTQWSDLGGTLKASPFVDDGTPGYTVGTPLAGSKWQLKNLFEIKAATNVQVDSNIFENHERGSDIGYSFWLKSVNQEGGCPFCGSGFITVEKNIIRHIYGFIELHGIEENVTGHPLVWMPPPMHDVTLRNNLVYDVSSAYGQGFGDIWAFNITDAVVNLTLDHNTVISTMTGSGNIVVDSGSHPPVSGVAPAAYQNPGFTMKNNMVVRQSFGIHSSYASEGTNALTMWMPGYSMLNNAMSDCASGSYPATNFCEPLATWQSEFVTYTATGTGADYSIKPTSAYHHAGTDGADIGADITLVNSATATVISGGATASSPTINSTSPLPNGKVGLTYSEAIVVSGGVAPLTFAITSGALPASLSISSSTGVISGTPSVAATSTFSVRVTDANAATSTVSFNLTVAAATPSLVFTTTTLPNSVVGAIYSQTLQVSGGVPPYTFALNSGLLPNALSLASSTGVINGVPDTVGTSTFVISVTDSVPTTITQSYTVVITNPIVLGNQTTVLADRFRLNNGGCEEFSGFGDPEGSFVGQPCDRFVRTDTGSIYLKITGIDTLGWMQLGTTISSPQSVDLTLQPKGDLITDPLGKDILPANGYDINIGSLQAKYLQLFAAELWVETLVAQNTIATIGGRVLVAPTNIVVSDIDPADATITVKYNNFNSGDIIYLEANGKVEFMSVDSGATGVGPYVYDVTRSLDATGADAWYAGDAILDTGTTGNGFIDLYSIAGVRSIGSGPAIVGNVRTGTAYNAWAPRWAIGNLNGLFGYATSIYGAAFGDPSATNVTVDATNGFRIRNNTTTKFLADTAGNMSLTGDLSVGTAGDIRLGATAFATGVGVWMDYNGGTPRWRVGNPAGNQIKWDGTTLTITGTASGNIATGGAAADVNANATTISGGKITTGTVTATQISVGSLSAISANIGTITAGSISGVTFTAGGGTVVLNGSGLSLTSGTGTSNHITWSDGGFIASNTGAMSLSNSFVNVPGASFSSTEATFNKIVTSGETDSSTFKMTSSPSVGVDSNSFPLMKSNTDGFLRYKSNTFNGTCSSPTSITIENGIVTACS